MRKMTKDKCYEMFPDLTSEDEKVSEYWFKEYERIISNELEKQTNKKFFIFNKDEIIDFFLLGASIAHQMLNIKYDNTICNFKHMKQIKEFFDKRQIG